MRFSSHGFRQSDAFKENRPRSRSTSVELLMGAHQRMHAINRRRRRGARHCKLAVRRADEGRITIDVGYWQILLQKSEIEE